MASSKGATTYSSVIAQMVKKLTPAIAAQVTSSNAFYNHYKSKGHYGDLKFGGQEIVEDDYTPGDPPYVITPNTVQISSPDQWLLANQTVMSTQAVPSPRQSLDQGSDLFKAVQEGKQLLMGGLVQKPVGPPPEDPPAKIPPVEEKRCRMIRLDEKLKT